MASMDQPLTDSSNTLEASMEQLQIGSLSIPDASMEQLHIRSSSIIDASSHTDSPTMLAAPDTPRLIRSTISGAEIRLDIVRQEIRAVPEVTFGFYKHSVLPKVEDAALEMACDKLKAEGDLTTDGWVTMRFPEPKGKKKTENHFYAPLATYFQKVVGQHSLIQFSSKPTSSQQSEGDHSSYMANIHGMLRETTAVAALNDKDYECDAAITGEFKKGDKIEDFNDDFKKLVSNANHILGADPTRRFMFGLTVEKYDTRFWFFSRSHAFVTEKLHLHNDFREIIRFALALGLATKEELGYDPTVRRVAVPSLPGSQYVYTVEGKDYITISPISVQKAKYLVGRAPRIFLVQRVIDLDRGNFDKDTKVLKDFWIPENAQTDLQMREYIRNNFQKVNKVPGLEKAAFDDYFVIIEACEKLQVPSTLDPHTLVFDNSSNFLRGHTLPRNHNWLHLSHPASHIYKSSPHSSIPHSQFTESARERDFRLATTTKEMTKLTFRSHYANKVHCRTVSEYAGETLEATKDWSTITMALSKSVIALSYMHSAGVVHRDVSAGNILVQGDKVKINDLEYAKVVEPRSESPSHTDMKTGTLFFMAVEVELHEYLFLPPLNRKNLADFRSQKRSLQYLQFQYSYLHDLESLYWILVFILLTKWPQSLPLSTEQCDMQRDTFRNIFYGGPQQRRDLLHNESTVVIKVLRAAVEELIDGWYEIFFLGSLLADKHREVQSTSPMIQNPNFETLHSEVQGQMDVIKEAVQWKGHLVYSQTLLASSDAPGQRSSGGPNQSRA